jgi:hypothetical protein
MKYLLKSSFRSAACQGVALRRSLVVLFLLSSVVCHLSSVLAADEVVPASLTITNLRDEATDFATPVEFFKGTSLRLTNCVAFAGTTTNSARQGLTDVTIEVKVGNTTTSATYSGTAQVATNGTWFCDVTVPTNSGACSLQVKITSATTNSYIYPWKHLNRKDAI